MTKRADSEDRRQQKLRRLGTQNPVCVVCGEADTDTLERHHIAGRQNNQDLAIVCANCHRKLSDRQRNRVPPFNLHSHRRRQEIGYYLIGLADLLELTAKSLRRFGTWLVGERQRSDTV
jgi:hypothetical protein